MPGLTNLFSKAFEAEKCDKGPKGHHYHHMYASLFNGFKPQSLLELGVYKGGSMRAWRRLFPEAKLTGVDHIERDFPAIDNFNYLKGDCTNPAFTAGIEKHDVIIDDASHHIFDQLLTFRNFKNKFNYYYVIEDIGWQHKPTAVEGVVRSLRDSMIQAGYPGVAVYDSFNDRHQCYAMVIQAKRF